MSTPKAAHGWIDIMASGHVFVRGKRQPRSGSLPCFDAGTQQDAETLVVFACVLSYDRDRHGRGIYAVPGFRLNDLNSISLARQRFEVAARVLAERRRRRAASNTVCAIALLRATTVLAVLLPACGGSAFGELTEAPDAETAPDHVAETSPDAEAPPPEASPPDAQPDAGHDAAPHDHDAAPEASPTPDAAPPPSEAAPPPVDAGPDSSPLAACTSDDFCRTLSCSTDTQFCIAHNPENTGSCGTWPAQCNTCGSHTCACLAEFDPNYASYTSCGGGDGYVLVYGP
jgi:hypothetical protein